MLFLLQLLIVVVIVSGKQRIGTPTTLNWKFLYLNRLNKHQVDYCRFLGILPQKRFIIHIINPPPHTHTHNFSIQNCLQNSDIVQFRFQSPERCNIKYLKNTKLYSIELLRTEMTSDPSNYHREYSPDGARISIKFSIL